MGQPKTKFEAARDFCSIFTSVGGGVLVAIFIYVIFSNWPPIQPLFILQLIPALIGFLRLYWFYTNSILFFSPFDSITLFGIDLAAFFTGGMLVSSIGMANGIPYFFFLASCLFVCSWRTRLAKKKAETKKPENLKDLYPSSYNKFKKGATTFERSLFILGIFSLLSGIVLLIVTHFYYLIFIICIILTIWVLFSMYYWIDEMWPDEEDSKKGVSRDS